MNPVCNRGDELIQFPKTVFPAFSLVKELNKRKEKKKIMQESDKVLGRGPI